MPLLTLLFQPLLSSPCDVFHTAFPATEFNGFSDSALRATCPAHLSSLTTSSFQWSCLILSECYHVPMLFVQQTTYCNIVQLCVQTERCACVRVCVRRAAGPHRPRAPLLRPSCASVVTTELVFLSRPVPHGDAPLTHQDFQLLTLRKASPSCGRSLAYI